MKRICSLIVITALLVSFTACGEKTDSDGTTAAATTTLAGETDPATTTGAAGTTSPTVQQGGQQVQPSVSKQQTTTTAKPYKAKYYSRYQQFIKLRGGLKNTSYKLTTDNELTVAFMGGSVTQGMGDSNSSGGWRGRVVTELKTDARYFALITDINASIGGNGSQYGTYMVDEFVASKKPDLVFIEYAVNNAYDGYRDAVYLWSHYETMIHKIRAANPYADIVLVYVSDENNRSKDIIPELEKIADYYNLPSVNLYEVLQDKINNSGYSWNSLYSDGVHPAERGYKFMAEAVHGLIESAMVTPSAAYTKATTPTAKSQYVKKNAKFVMTPKLSTVPDGWVKDTSFPQNKTNGCVRTTDPTKTITIKFKGTDFGVLVAFGPQYGKLAYQIDGGMTQTLDCYLSYENPKARMMYENGKDGEHTIKLCLQGTNAEMAIAAFMVNGTIISVQ